MACLLSLVIVVAIFFELLEMRLLEFSSFKAKILFLVYDERVRSLLGTKRVLGQTKLPP